MSIYENPLYLICGNINHVQKIENRLSLYWFWCIS